MLLLSKQINIFFNKRDLRMKKIFRFSAAVLLSLLISSNVYADNRTANVFSTGNLTVLVVDSLTGLPVNKASINLRSTDLSGKTDTTGFCFFNDIPADSVYSIRINKQGYIKKIIKNITVNNGTSDTVTVSLCPVYPQISEIIILPNPSGGADSIEVSAKLKFKIDTVLTIKRAECFIDNDPGFGNGILMNAIDGKFNSRDETVKAKLDLSTLTDTVHTLYIRGKNSKNIWGITFSAQFTKTLDTGLGGSSSPYFLTTTLKNATERVGYCDTVSAFSPDGSNITFKLYEGPGWLYVDSSGVLGGTPSYTDLGTGIPVIIQAVNENGYMDIFNTTINVSGKLSANNELNSFVIQNNDDKFTQGFTDSSYIKIVFKSGEVAGKNLNITRYAGLSSHDKYGSTPMFSKTIGYYEISTDAAGFSASLRFGYNETLLQEKGISENDLVICFLDENDYRGKTWKVVSSNNNISNKIIKTTVNHFSLWTVTTKTEALITGILDNNNHVPGEFELFQNYPNPFNPATEIRYAIPKASFVKLEIFSETGRLIRTLVSKDLPTGYHKEVWDGRNDTGIKVGSGLYIFRISTGNFRAVKKMTLLK